MSRKERMEQILNQEITPLYLDVADESANHHVPEGAETHFKVIAVSKHFHDLTHIARHRLVNGLLGKEFDLGLHALSMHLYTPSEWEKKQNVLKSPSCRDGYKNK